MKSVNTALFEEKLGREAKNIPSALLGPIREFVLSARDTDLAVINPVRVADRLKTDRIATLKAFLHLTKAGVFDLEWAVHCPHCKGVSQHAGKLSELTHASSCGGCQVDFDASFDRNTEIRFKPNPGVLQLGEMDPFQLNMAGFETEPGISFDIEPGGEHFLQVEVDHGNWFLVNLDAKKVVNFNVSGETASKVQEYTLDFSDATPPFDMPSLKSGELAMRIVNHSGEAASFLFAKMKSQDWTSASLVSTLQEFRDLFSREMLSGSEAFSIKNLSFLFTDIKSSTEMYERLGDSSAFWLVKEHFKIMESVVRMHNGGIVKTIGDAVMAVFSLPSDALACSVEMIEAFDRFNSENATKDNIIIKVGIHSGPCIAVTLNERIDYFGTTVNTAARVQGLSDGRDVMLSDRFYAESGASGYLGGRNWSSESFITSLKGLSDSHKIHKLVKSGS